MYFTASQTQWFGVWSLLCCSAIAKSQSFFLNSLLLYDAFWIMSYLSVSDIMVIATCYLSRWFTVAGMFSGRIFKTWQGWALRCYSCKMALLQRLTKASCSTQKEQARSYRKLFLRSYIFFPHSTEHFFFRHLKRSIVIN